MLTYIIIILPLLMSFLARLAGGGLFANKIPSRLPEILFAIPFAIVGSITFGPMIVGLTVYPFLIAGACSFLISYFSMEMGHGTFYGMAGWRSSNPNRIQTIEHVVRPIYKLFSSNIEKPLYSWLCMGLKGLPIALPLGPLALVNMIAWPLAYHIGHVIENTPEVAEWVSGAVGGTLVSITLALLLLQRNVV